jgi:hypothetical protein
MLLVDFAVDDEKGSSSAIKAVMLFQSGVEFFRVTTNHGLIDQGTRAGLRRSAEKHAADDRPRVSDTLIDHDLFLEVFVRQSDGFPEALHQGGVGRLFDKQLDKLIVGGGVAGIPDHAVGEPFVDGVIGKIVL